MRANVARPGRSAKQNRPGLAVVRCVNILACRDGMPTTENSTMWPQCCMVGIRLTISRQCDMVVSSVVRHSGRSAFRHQSNIAATNFYIIDSHVEVACGVSINTESGDLE